MRLRAPSMSALLGLLLLVAGSLDAQNRGSGSRAGSRSEFKALYLRLLTLEDQLTPYKETGLSEVEPVARERLDASLEALDEALAVHPETGSLHQQLTEARGDLETAVAAEDAAATYRAKKTIATLKRLLDEKQGILPELRVLGKRVAEARHLVERSQLRHDPVALELLDRVHEMRRRLAELKAEIESSKTQR